MNDVITDIKLIRVKTGGVFTLSECKDAYEISDRDIDKAIELLNEKKATDSSVATRKGGRQQEIGVNNTFASLFALITVLCFISGIVLTVLACIKLVEVFAPFVAFGLSILCFVMFGILTSKSKTCKEMSDEEFAEQQADEITRKPVVYLDYDNEAIVCPHCGSHDILLKDKKFSKSKAFLGMTAFGVKGVVFGIPSHKRAKCCCGHCGHKFEVVRR